VREWILLNPGPANTTPTVRQALVMPDLCHREPECFEMMRAVRERLVRLSGASDRFTAVVLCGSGTAAVAATIASAVPPGQELVVDNGVYGTAWPASRAPTDRRPRRTWDSDT
jgi:2-aminoethylphosphonate-pyruvate transaminase